MIARNLLKLCHCVKETPPDCPTTFLWGPVQEQCTACSWGCISQWSSSTLRLTVGADRDDAPIPVGVSKPGTRPMGGNDMNPKRSVALQSWEPWGVGNVDMCAPTLCLVTHWPGGQG